MLKLASWVAVGLVGAYAGATAGCSDSTTSNTGGAAGSGNQGTTTSSGGSSQGGATQGGATQGGATQGGATQGGASQGGATQGGASQGGASAGGGTGGLASGGGSGGACTEEQCQAQGLTCCDGECVGTYNDVDNCGSCNNACQGANPFCDGTDCATAPCSIMGCMGPEFCCGDECCAQGQLCCDVPTGGPGSGPACTDPVNGTCPLGCPLCD